MSSSPATPPLAITGSRVAFASGFGTAERFYKVFRKQVAMTPLEYRRSRRL